MNVNEACAHYVMVSKFQWKPFWLATQRDPQNDWTATENRVNYDVFAQAPSLFMSLFFMEWSPLTCQSKLAEVNPVPSKLK